MNSLSYPVPHGLVRPPSSAATPVARSSARLDRASTSPAAMLLLALLAGSSPAFAQFEGYGKGTTGGSGRPVCTVTSGAEQGAGTWDACVQKGGNQIIQFAVAVAKVYETSYLKSNTTVDGCANGQNGVTLDQPANKKRAVAIEGPVSNVIVRCIRFRGSGPDHPGYAVEDDLLRLDGTGGQVSRVVVDHCTFAGSTDGALDTTGYVSDVTESWNLFYGTALTQLIKYDTRQRISLHHNVYTAGGERNPQIKGDARAIDFVSNIVYNETITKDGVGNTFNPYGTRLWNANSASDSPGNVRVNIRSSFYGGAHAGIDIMTDAGASAAGIYIAADNVCSGSCGHSPAAALNAVTPGYEVTATPVGCMVYEMLPRVGAPNRSDADLARIDAVKAVLPRACPQNLTVTKAGTGSGVVNSAPSGVACGADCAQAYAYGTVVNLSAVAAKGSQFKGWGGACAGTGSCYVSMSAAKSVTATFDLIPYPLNVARTGTGSATVSSSPAGITCGADCAQVYNYGTIVTLNPVPASGTVFIGWSGACAGTGACRVTMDAAKSVTANFRALYALTVTKTGKGGVAASPAGITCGSGCQRYDPGTVVTLSPLPDSGYGFAGWSGACAGTGACQVTMNAARSVSASFEVAYNLTVTKAGSGSVTSSPAGISCGADCSQAYTTGTVVTLSQAPASGSVFTGWSGACTGTGACRVTMNGTRSVTAGFKVLYTLTVTKTGSGGVAASPAGIACGSGCQRYDPGTVVTLSPLPASGYGFAGWSGSCAGTGACRVTMSAARAVSASFKVVYALTVAKAGTGTGTVVSTPAGIACGSDCSQAYNSGTVIVLSPAAAAGSRFVGWSEACTGTGSCQVTMNTTRRVTASFAKLPAASLQPSSDAAAASPTAGGFYTLTPCRVVDTRLPFGPHGGPPLAARLTRAFPMFGACGIPASARALSLNVTVTGATSAGSLRLFPADVRLPGASSLSYAAGQARANNVTMGLSPSGELAVYCDQVSGSAHVVVDVSGYYE